MTSLTALVLVYLALLFWFGIRGSTEDLGLKHFLTAGGKTGALLCALSLTSTIIGGSATLGIGGLAQKIGAAAFWWLGVGAIGLFLHGLVVAPVIRRLPVITLPDVLRLLVGPAAEKWAGAIIAVSWIAVTAAQFAALHALLGSISPGVLGEAIYCVIALMIVAHTALGGQKGVIRADALHCVLLLGGFAAAVIWCFAEKSPEISSLPTVPFNERFGVADWVKMLLLVGITYVIGPDMFSRTFAARNSATARRAAFAAAPLLVVFGAAVTMLALLNIDAKQPISDWLGSASPLPEFVAALLAMGLISALAGSADTVLLSAAGIIEKDLLGKSRSRAVRIWAGAIGTLAALAVWASGDIIGWLIKGYAFFVPGVAVPLLVLVAGRARKARERVWLAGAALGGAGGLISSLTGEMLFTYAGMAVSFAAALTAVALERRCEH